MWPICDQCFLPGSVKVDSLFRITDTKVESPFKFKPWNKQSYTPDEYNFWFLRLCSLKFWYFHWHDQP